jgi:hypothetical protein
MASGSPQAQATAWIPGSRVAWQAACGLVARHQLPSVRGPCY